MTAVSLGLLFKSGRDLGAPTAIRDDVLLRFGQFAADVSHTAANVRSSGATRGAVLSADPYRFLVGMFGLLHAGATVVLPPDDLPATLLDLSDRFDVLMCDEPSPVQLTTIPIEHGPRDAAAPGALDPATAMLEFFTSGSTGAAKLVAKPLAMLDLEIAMLETKWGAGMGRGAVMATVPHRHVFGLTFHLLWPLAKGRPFVSHVFKVWESVLARDMTGAVLVTSPEHLMRLGGIPRLPRGRGAARVFTAGGPLRADHAREAAEVLGVAPTEIFGSTETGAIATRVQNGSAEPWQPLPGIQVDANADGRMIVQSPFGPTGGPFLSADRIELTPDGSFHFLGRADRIAKIGGRRISLPRLEAELVALPWLRDAAAAVVGDAPERLAAAVVLTDEGRLRLDALGSFRFGRELRRQLALVLESAWLPKSWRFVDELPSGTMGKRRDADIRSLFAQSPGEVP